MQVGNAFKGDDSRIYFWNGIGGVGGSVVPASEVQFNGKVYVAAIDSDCFFLWIANWQKFKDEVIIQCWTVKRQTGGTEGSTVTRYAAPHSMRSLMLHVSPELKAPP